MAASKGKSNSNNRNTSSYKKKRTKTQMKKDYELKQEVLLIITIAACLLLLLCNFGLIGTVGQFLSNIMFGMFGLTAYIFPVILFICIMFKSLNPGNPKANVKVTFWLLTMFDLGLVTDLIGGLSRNKLDKYSVKEIYSFCMENKKGGGVISGSVAYFLVKYISTVGALAVFAVILLICIIFLTEKSFLDKLRNGTDRIMTASAENRLQKQEYLKEQDKRREEYDRKRLEREQARQKEAELAQERKLEREQRRLKNAELEEQRRIEREQLNADKREQREKSRLEKEEKTAAVREQKETQRILRVNNKVSGITTNTVIARNDVILGSNTKSDIHEINVNGFEPSNIDNIDEYGNATEREIILYEEIEVEEQDTGIAYKGDEITEIKPFDDSLNSVPIKRTNPEATVTKTPAINTPSNQNSTEKAKPYYEPAIKRPEEVNAPLGKPQNELSKMADQAQNSVVKEYVFPSIELLKENKGVKNRDSEADIRETAGKLIETLAIFGVKANVTEISQGPTVTRFEIQPELGVKVSRIKSLSDDIKLSLAASDIRMEAPIPGKSAVGIEIPNKTNQAVLLRELIDTDEFRKSKSNLAFAIGKDIEGKTIVYDIDKFPHLLIAGATGSGKSVCINTLIMSIIYKANPDDVKLIMIDPKVVELSVYNGIPHLLIPVVTEAKKASGALNWAVSEMMERYKRFADLNVRDLEGYNETVAKLNDPTKPKLPQIVIIVDELADLMMVAKNDVEEAICRLAQLARACGIHLIIATQRPSVDVITGLIKANMPSRIAFAVSSAVDSRTILDMGGAEELLGKGDMLFFPKGMKKPLRLQGGFVSDNEVNDVVNYLKQYEPAEVSVDIQEKINSGSTSSSSEADSSTSSEFDEYFMDAAKLIIEKNKASIGMLQRMFKIGFNRAARIMDKLAEYGVVSEEDGTKARKVLMNMTEFENFVEENGL